MQTKEYFKPGDIVLYREFDKETREQKVQLIKETREPKWVKEDDNTVWLFEAIEDGDMYAEGEQSYARTHELNHIDE